MEIAWRYLPPNMAIVAIKQVYGRYKPSGGTRNLVVVLKCYKPLAMGDARPSTAKDVSGLIPSLLCSCLRISLVLSTHLLAWLGPCYSERKKQDHQPTAAEKQDLAGDFC